MFFYFFFFKQKTAYEMRISDWSSDVCSSDLVVAHLISEKVESGADPVDAVRDVLTQLRGAFALAILCRSQPDLLIGARLGSPLVVGVGEGETYLGSDALALASLTQMVTYLEAGDCVLGGHAKTQIYDKDHHRVTSEHT